MIEETKDMVSVDFYNTKLTAIKKDGDTYIAMKPIVEGIGLEWSGQHKKLSDKKKFSCVDIYTTGKDNKQYQMLCIPRIKESIRADNHNCRKVAKGCANTPWHSFITIEPK